MVYQSINLLKTPYKTPYRGLMPYLEEDAEYFFGREKDRNNIIANLKGSALTVLYGSSGVGKSSVLQAGVAYTLQQEAKQNFNNCGTPEFAIVVFNSWRDDPLVGLANLVRQSVAQAMERNVSELIELFPWLVQNPPTLTQTFQGWSNLLTRKDVRGKLFIILDQFEEYFLYHPEEEGEGTFFAEFPRVVNRPDVNFLISIREDALAQLDRLKAKIPSLFDNYLRIRHIDAQSAYRAIVKPIEKYNELASSEQPISIEEDLAKVVIDQVGQFVRESNGRGGLEKLRPQLEKQVETPYLQLVITRLWEEEMNAGSRCLQLKTFLNLGGAKQIVTDHLNEKMESLSEEEKKAAAKVFQYLVTPSGNKIAYSILDLVKLTGLKEKQLNNLLEKLSNGRQRILRPVGPSPSQPDIERYEIFHDILAQPILEWRKQYLVDEEKQRGNLAIKEGLPAQSLRQLKLGRHEIAALLARQAYLFYQREPNKVLYQIDEALRETVCIDYFNNCLRGHNGISALAFNPQSYQILASADYQGNILLWDLRRQSEVSQRIKLKDFHKKVNALAYSPDGKMLASGSSDGKIYLWRDLTNLDQPQILGHHDESVASIAFNWNGTILASGSDDKTIKLWNTENKSETKPIAILGKHAKAIRSVAFSPDQENGYLLASGSKDRRIILWDIHDNSCLAVLTDHIDVVRSVAFNPKNSQMLASGSEDNKVIIWDLSNLEKIVEIKSLTEHQNGVLSVAFSSDGKWLASGSVDQTIQLWKLDPSKPENILLKETLRGHNFGISAVAFSSDNQILASGSWDKTIRLWHLHPSKAIPQILGRHKDNIMSVAVSPDGQWLASGSWDNKVRLWDVRNPKTKPELLKEYEHGDKVFAVAFDHNSQMLASASADRTIRLLNLQELEENPQVLKGHVNGVSSVAFSPDGLWLVSGSWRKEKYKKNDQQDDRTVRLWDLQSLKTTEQPVSKILWRHENSVTSVAFSPDGQMLASGSDDATIKLLDLRKAKGSTWDLIYEQSSNDFPQNSVSSSIATLVNDHKARFIPLKGHDDRVWSVAFNPKRKMLASGSDDRTIRLWDLSQEEEKPQVIPVGKKEHNFRVGSVAFSPDGQKLASGSYDKNIRVWDLNHLGEEPIVLRGHEQSVTSIAFYHDSKKLVSGSYDNTIQEWIVDTKFLADLVCETVQRNLSHKEWKWFMGDDIPYERTCPNLPAGEGTSEVTIAEEVSELEREFRDKLAQLFAGQKYVLEFIKRKTAQQPDISEEDVTNFLNKPKGDDGTYYRLETLRLYGFLEITDKGHEPGTIRYGLSPRYQEYLSKIKANKA